MHRSSPAAGDTTAVADTSLLDPESPAPHAEHEVRNDGRPPCAPNTVFVYLCSGADGARQVRRVVVRGVCTRAHEERILSALSRGRYFLGAVATGEDGDADHALACCELVSIAPTLAGASDQRDVEALVRQLEAAALHGWNGRTPQDAAP